MDVMGDMDNLDLSDHNTPERRDVETIDEYLNRMQVQTVKLSFENSDLHGMIVEWTAVPYTSGIFELLWCSFRSNYGVSEGKYY